jgi:serine/threonine protein kinase
MERLQGDVPRRLGRFTLQARLGAGGMGVVYRAIGDDGTAAVVKVIRAELADDAVFRRRFAHEVRALRRVRGLCVIGVLDAEVDADRPWFAMEYVPGHTLDDQVRGQGPLTGVAARALAAGLAEGLQAFHEAGVIHRDVKPANILLSPAGPKLIDFGIARLDTATHLTGTNLCVGSPAWMAPEQVTGGAITAAVDVFALGLVIAFAVTGRLPFGEGPAAAMLYRVVHCAPELTGVPDTVRAAVERALEKHPDDRPTARELLELLISGPVPDPARAVTVLLARDWPTIPLDPARGRGVVSSETAATPTSALAERRRSRPIVASGLFAAAACAMIVMTVLGIANQSAHSTNAAGAPAAQSPFPSSPSPLKPSAPPKGTRTADPDPISTPSTISAPDDADESATLRRPRSVADAVKSLFDTYFGAINAGNYVAAYAQLSSSMQRRTSLRKFTEGLTSTMDVDIELHDVSATRAGARAHVTFTSLQSPDTAANGEACTKWNLDYRLTIGDNAQYVIDGATGHDGSPYRRCS